MSYFEERRCEKLGLYHPPPLLTRCRRSFLRRAAVVAVASAAASGHSCPLRVRCPPRPEAKGRGSQGHSSISCQDCLTCQNCSGSSFSQKKVLRAPDHKILLKDTHVLKGKCNYVYKFRLKGGTLISANTHNLLSFSIIHLEH